MENIILNVIILVLGLCALYFILWTRLKKLVNPHSILNEISGEVQKIMVELNSTTDQNIQIIEDRIKLLKEHLILADKKISLLKRENSKPEVTLEYNDILSRQKPAIPEPTIEISEDISEEIPLKDRVIMYHKEGFLPAVIAGKVNLPIGEVELIISLAKQLSKD